MGALCKSGMQVRRSLGCEMGFGQSKAGSGQEWWNVRISNGIPGFRNGIG